MPTRSRRAITILWCCCAFRRGIAVERRFTTEAPVSTTVTVNVRQATRADLPALGRLGAVLVRSHHDYDPRRFIAASSGTEDGYGSFLGSQIDEPDIVLLVAEFGGEVLGYSYAGVEGMDWMSLRGP